MDYKLFELKFNTGVHFGFGMLNDSTYIIKADTLFSAMCIEAQKMGCLEELIGYVKRNQLILSDGMPYVKKDHKQTVYLIPKPMIYIESDNRGDSNVKKKIKNLKYIPIENLSDYLTGKIQNIDEDTQKIGCFEGVTKSKRSRAQEDTEPYHVGSYHYHENRGLYFVVGYHSVETYDLVKRLFEMISFSGIGGKRSAGFGKFSFEVKDLPNSFQKRLRDKKEYEIKMSLSVSLPKEEELEKALEGCSYFLEKRSGFIYSNDYADEYTRKRDMYVFGSGSCFSNVFVGDIYDVSGENGRHPVYRYAKVMLLGVKK